MSICKGKYKAIIEDLKESYHYVQIRKEKSKYK